MIKITETKNRNVLSEGRDTGMGFAMLKHVDNENYNTVQPLSPCKDYLNEVIYTESTGKGSQGCGLTYPDKLDIYLNDRFFLAIKIVKNQSNTSYYYSKSYEADIETLKANRSAIEKYMNYFDDKLGLTLTSIEEAQDGYFLVSGDMKWCQSTYSISLFSLLLRLGLYYDGTVTPEEYLESYAYNVSDKQLLNGIRAKLKYILETKQLPKFYDIAGSPHGYGICSWGLPSTAALV